MPAATMWACKRHMSCTCTKVWRLSYIRMTLPGGPPLGALARAGSLRGNVHRCTVSRRGPRRMVWAVGLWAA